jgi:hypothetical protein
MANVHLQPEIIDIYVIESKKKPNCGTLTRRSAPGTYETVRAFAACKTELRNEPSLSSGSGEVKVPGLTLAHGPVGIYAYRYSDNSSIRSPRLFTYLGSTVDSLKVLTPSVPSAAYGVRLSLQPRIKVIDLRGEPIAGKRVVAMSCTEFNIDVTESWHFNLQGRAG